MDDLAHGDHSAAVSAFPANCWSHMPPYALCDLSIARAAGVSRERLLPTTHALETSHPDRALQLSPPHVACMCTASSYMPFNKRGRWQ